MNHVCRIDRSAQRFHRASLHVESQQLFRRRARVLRSLTRIRNEYLIVREPIQRHTSAMCPCNLLDQGETHAGATHSRRIMRVSSNEIAEDALALFDGNAGIRPGKKRLDKQRGRLLKMTRAQATSRPTQAN